MSVALSAHCGAPPQQADEAPLPPTDSTPVGELQVFYADMIEAYDSGRLAEARQLVGVHLSHLEQRMENPPHETERSSVVHGTLGVLRSMLGAENKLPTSERLGQHRDLISQVDRVFLRAKEMRGSLTAARADMLDYIDRETGIVAAEWIGAKQALVSRDRLAETFSLFSDDLGRAGYRSLDEILTRKTSLDMQVPPVLVVTPQVEAGVVADRNVTGSMTAGMDLVLKTERESYLLGEPVRLILTAENNSGEPIVTSLVMAPTAGMVQLLISQDGEEFRQYRGPGWSTRDVYRPPAPVEPGASFDQPLDVLWNDPVPGDDRFLARRFAFQSVGCYTLKASSRLQNFDSESNTVEVCVTDPTGQDLSVWQLLQTEPELAMFIQRPISDVSESVRVRVQELKKQYASTTYGPYLEKAIRERREYEAQSGR